MCPRMPSRRSCGSALRLRHAEEAVDRQMLQHLLGARGPVDDEAIHPLAAAEPEVQSSIILAGEAHAAVDDPSLRQPARLEHHLGTDRAAIAPRPHEREAEPVVRAVLGLTTLTVIRDALDNIQARTGTRPDLDAVDMADPRTYQMLRAGRTTGVFQFESPLATDMLRAIRCDSFDDLVASNALLRPGPLDAGMQKVSQRRKRGEEPVSYPLPELEPILRPTYGVITYQEQVMRLAQTIAGISLAEADVLRKAVGKKDAELIKKELGKFVEKSIARGYDRKIIEDLSGQIETFGRYGFNKSHSVAYSVVSFYTAWLKAHFPADFMAAILSSSIGDTDSVVKFINEARELGIEVLPPDVNESNYKFTVLDEKRIRFGLGAIRNVGRNAIDSILGAKREKPFESFFDFVDHVDLSKCNRRVFEALISAGALDGLGGHRAQYWSALEPAMQEASLKQQEKAMGQVSLFGGPVDDANGEASTAPRTLPNVAPMAESERLTREKEILGFYIS